MARIDTAAVVGGGMAGLAAAVALTRAGVAVRVYEQLDEVGGHMRSDRIGTATVDPAVQLVSSTYTSLFGLTRETGTRDLLVLAPGRDALWRGERVHGITYGSVGSMVTSSALPTMLKMRLGTRYLPFLNVSARSLDANDPVATGGVAHDDESVATWGRREIGNDFVELLAYPLLAAYYGSLPEKTSAALYHGLARTGMDVRVHVVTGGAGQLPRAIAEWLVAQGTEVHTGSKVEAIAVRDDAVRINADGAEWSCDAVVLATPSGTTRSLLAGTSSLTQWLDGVHTAPTATAAFLLDAPLDPDWFGLSFPRESRPGARIAAIAAQSRKLASLVPEGEAIVVYPQPELGARIASAAPQRIVDEVMPGLAAAFPGIEAHVLRARIYAFPEGYSLFPPGSLRHLQAFAQVDVPPRLALAGAYLVAPSVEGAVRSGLRAAERLLR